MLYRSNCSRLWDNMPNNSLSKWLHDLSWGTNWKLPNARYLHPKHRCVLNLLSITRYVFLIFSIEIGPIGPDRAACVVACPVTCPLNHMTCSGGSQANGCLMPDTCVSLTGKYTTYYYLFYTQGKSSGKLEYMLVSWDWQCQ